MIQEKINTRVMVKMELGMTGTTQAQTLTIHKTVFRFAILLGGKPITCYVKNTDFGPVMQFGRLLIPCHSAHEDDDTLCVTIPAFDAGRMISYAASRKWDWRGGTDALHAEYRAENGHNIGEALKTVLA